MSQGYPGYNASMFWTGTSTAMTDEATTEISGTLFQITDTAKRILDDDPDNAPVVKVNTVVQSSGYSIDYNTGKITFDSSQTGSTVTITANYLPRHEKAKLETYTVELSYDSVDSTEIGEAAEANTLTIQRARIGIDSVRPLDDDVYSTTDASAIFFAKGIKVIEVQPAGSGQEVIRIRGVFDQASFNFSGPADIVRGSLNLIGATRGTTLWSVDTI